LEQHLLLLLLLLAGCEGVVGVEAWAGPAAAAAAAGWSC
jgi:hypothetical protein